MTALEPKSRSIDAADARDAFDDVVAEVARGEGRVVIEQNGVPVVAVVSTRELQRFAELEAERDARYTILDEIGAAFVDVSDDEIEREVARAIAQARRERRHGRTEVQSFGTG